MNTLSNDFLTFQSEVYQELDALKNKLSIEQKMLLDSSSYSSLSVNNSLYGQLFGQAWHTSAKKFCSKKYQMLLTDIADNNTFERGASFTALEKLLATDSGLTLFHCMVAYIGDLNRNTPEISHKLESIRQEIITFKHTVKQPQVLEYDEEDTNSEIEIEIAPVKTSNEIQIIKVQEFIM